MKYKIQVLPINHIIEAEEQANLLACDQEELRRAQELIEKIEFIELADIPQFQSCFAKKMYL